MVRETDWGEFVTEVLSVIQNWRRPGNVARIVDAIRSQSIPSRLAIVDCAIGVEYALPPDVLAKADYVFRVDRANLGPCCRFIPSLMIPDIPFTMFWLDDFLPGPECLASFMRWKSSLSKCEAATIGQDGRLFASDGTIIRRRMFAKPGEFELSDVIVSSELCRTEHVAHAITFRNDMVAEYGAQEISLFEDDLYLCLGVRRWLRGVKSAVFTPANAEESHRAERLPDNDGLASRPDHDARRADFVRKALPLLRR